MRQCHEIEELFCEKRFGRILLGSNGDRVGYKTKSRFKYGSVPDAQQTLGSIQEIQETFVDFQRHLYEEVS